MRVIQSAVLLALQGIVFPVYLLFQPLGWIALTVGTMFALRVGPPRNQTWNPKYWLFLTHLVFFAASIGVGVAYNKPAVGVENDPVMVLYLKWIWYGSLVSAVFWTWRMKGCRWLAMGLMVLLEIFTAGAIFAVGIEIVI